MGGVASGQSFRQNRQLLKAVMPRGVAFVSSARQTESHRNRVGRKGVRLRKRERGRERECVCVRVSEHAMQTNDTQTGKQANKAKAKTTNKWPKFAHGSGRGKTKEQRGRC